MTLARDITSYPAFLNRTFVRVILFFAILFTFLAAGAQTTYQLKKVDLPSRFKYTEIRAMVQDNDGYIWFTTSQGLWRFDGTDVEPVNISDSHVAQTAVPDFIWRYRDFLLIAFEGQNTVRLVAFNMVSKKLSSYAIDDHPEGAYTDALGSLVFYSLRGQRWQFSPDAKLTRAENLHQVRGWSPPERFDNIFHDRDGATYVFYLGKIARYLDGKIQTSSPAPEDSVLKKFHFNFVIVTYSTPRYILTKFSNGFIIYDKATLNRAYTYYNINDVLVAADGDGFAVLTPPGIHLPPVAGLFRTQPLDFTSTGIIKNFAGTGTQHEQLIGTTNGIFELSAGYPARDQSPVSDFFRNKSIRSIYRLRNGKMYLGTYAGFYCVENGKITQVNRDLVYCMYPINADSLLLGIEGGKGFATFDTRTNQRTLFNDGGRYMYGFCLARDRDGFVGGTTLEMFRLQPDGDQPWLLNMVLRTDSIGYTKQLLPAGGYWWIAAANGLFKLGHDNHLEKVFPKNGKYAVYTVLPDGDNFWIGTGAHGLMEIDRRGRIIRQIKFSDGLAGDFVYSLYKVNGLLFAGTNEGLSVFDMHAGMRSIDPPDDPQYAEEMNHSAMFYDEYRHQLILGGVHGLLFPDMQHYQTAQERTTDRIRLSYVKRGAADGRPPETDLFAGQQSIITLEPGYTFMGLKFSGSQLWRQRSLLFRLPELDTTWHKSNIGTEISFYGLAPGKYTLQARLPSASDRRQWLTKTIIVAPHFYQTFLFKFLIGLSIALLIYMAWLYRVRKIRDEHLLRTTIASDLHDEIGSALTRISFSSELMSIKQQMDTRAVEKISADSKGAIASISDIIWSVDARNDTKDDLLMRIREHANNLLEHAAALHFEENGLEQIKTLPQLVRQNIYMVFKEAINNIARHNVSPEVWITLDNQASGMTITIKNTIDTGKRKSAHTGQGLRNMQMRAKRLKATIDINNDGNVFTVIIKMKRW